MVFGLIGIAVLAFGAFGWAVSLNKKLSDNERAADVSQAKAQLAIAGLNEEVEQARQKAAKLDSEISKLKSERSDLSAKVERQRQGLAEATSKADAQDAEIALKVAELETLAHERDGLTKKLAVALGEAAEADGRTGLEILAESGPVPTSVLWDLELERSVRTWRTSVSANPSDTTTDPFADAEDTVRKAVEIEAAALREDVGASVTVDWQAEVIADPARRLLLLRVAHELMTVAAREPHPTKLVVAGGDELLVEVEKDADADTVITLSRARVSTTEI